MHLIWGDLSLKHTRSIFLTFLSFSRSHNSLFTWTCCLFLSLSVPSSVLNRGLQGVQTCSGFDVIYVIFWGIFQFYLFSLILFRFCCFTPEKPRSCWSLLRYLYICNSKHFYFIFFFLFHWSDHIWSLWSYLPAETTGGHVTSFSTIRC